MGVSPGILHALATAELVAGSATCVTEFGSLSPSRKDFVKPVEITLGVNAGTGSMTRRITGKQRLPGPQL